MSEPEEYVPAKDRYTWDITTGGPSSGKRGSTWIKVFFKSYKCCRCRHHVQELWLLEDDNTYEFAMVNQFEHECDQ